MIGRQGTELRRKLGAVLVGQLLGVKADPKSVLSCGLEQARDFVGAESDRVAIGIDAGRELRLGDLGQKLVDDFADIMGAAVLAVGGERVEREQGRDNPDRLPLAEPACDPEQAQLARGVERVAGLDLDGRAAAGHQGMEATPALFEKRLVRCGLGRGHGRGDSAANPGDLLVAGACAAHRMLPGAIAGETRWVWQSIRPGVTQAPPSASTFFAR